MGAIQRKSLDAPDETRSFGKGKFEVVQLGAVTVGRTRFEPGWKWSEHVKPLAKTDSCQVNHIGYMISGRMRVKMDDGSEEELGPGDAVVIPPGHDAWVVGDEPMVFLDVSGGGEYAKPG